mmetsp:Transcript_22489/g.56842  ORF Transcript_22489/g.56842 Transcript_22489/m.56842 type:complete len:2347 (-) Transcript_22489:525-7565(-)
MTFRTLEDTNLYVVCLESLELADVGPLGGSVITTWYTAASDASACSGNDATVATRARRYFAEPESGETTVFLNFVVFLEGAGASEAGAEEAAADGTTGSSLYLQLSTAEGLPVASAGPISVLDDLAQSDNFEPCEVFFYSTDPKSGEDTEEERPVAKGTLSSARQTRVVAEEEGEEGTQQIREKSKGSLRFVDESDAQVWHLFSTCYPDQAQEYADQVQEPPDQRSMLSTIHEGPESPGSVELDQLGMSGAGGGSGSRTGGASSGAVQPDGEDDHEDTEKRRADEAAARSSRGHTKTNSPEVAFQAGREQHIEDLRAAGPTTAQASATQEGGETDDDDDDDPISDLEQGPRVVVTRSVVGAAAVVARPAGVGLGAAPGGAATVAVAPQRGSAAEVVSLGTASASNQNSILHEEDSFSLPDNSAAGGRGGGGNNAASHHDDNRDSAKPGAAAPTPGKADSAAQVQDRAGNIIQGLLTEANVATIASAPPRIEINLRQEQSVAGAGSGRGSGERLAQEQERERPVRRRKRVSDPVPDAAAPTTKETESQAVTQNTSTSTVDLLEMTETNVSGMQQQQQARAALGVRQKSQSPLLLQRNHRGEPLLTEDAETKMAAPAADALFGSGLDKARATPPRGSGTDAGTPTLEVVADEQHNAPALVSRGSSDTSLRAAGLQTLTQTRISPTLLATNTNMSAGQEELHEQQPQQLQQTVLQNNFQVGGSSSSTSTLHRSPLPARTPLSQQRTNAQNNPNLMTSADTLMQTILPPGSANKDPLSQTQLTTIMNGDVLTPLQQTTSQTLLSSSVNTVFNGGGVASLKSPPSAAAELRNLTSGGGPGGTTDEKTKVDAAPPSANQRQQFVRAGTIRANYFAEQERRRREEEMLEDEEEEKASPSGKRQSADSAPPTPTTKKSSKVLSRIDSPVDIWPTISKETPASRPKTPDEEEVDLHRLLAPVSEEKSLNVSDFVVRGAASANGGLVAEPVSAVFAPETTGRINIKGGGAGAAVAPECDVNVVGSASSSCASSSTVSTSAGTRITSVSAAALRGGSGTAQEAPSREERFQARLRQEIARKDPPRYRADRSGEDGGGAAGETAETSDGRTKPKPNTNSAARTAVPPSPGEDFDPHYTKAGGGSRRVSVQSLHTEYTSDGDNYDEHERRGQQAALLQKYYEGVDAVAVAERSGGPRHECGDGRTRSSVGAHLRRWDTITGASSKDSAPVHHPPSSDTDQSLGSAGGTRMIWSGWEERPPSFSLMREQGEDDSAGNRPFTGRPCEHLASQGPQHFSIASSRNLTKESAGAASQHLEDVVGGRVDRDSRSHLHLNSDVEAKRASSKSPFTVGDFVPGGEVREGLLLPPPLPTAGTKTSTAAASAKSYFCDNAAPARAAETTDSTHPRQSKPPLASSKPPLPTQSSSGFPLKAAEQERRSASHPAAGATAPVPSSVAPPLYLHISEGPDTRVPGNPPQHPSSHQQPYRQHQGVVISDRPRSARRPITATPRASADHPQPQPSFQQQHALPRNTAVISDPGRPSEGVSRARQPSREPSRDVLSSSREGETPSGAAAHNISVGGSSAASLSRAAAAREVVERLNQFHPDQRSTFDHLRDTPPVSLGAPAVQHTHTTSLASSGLHHHHEQTVLSAPSINLPPPQISASASTTGGSGGIVEQQHYMDGVEESGAAKNRLHEHFADTAVVAPPTPQRMTELVANFPALQQAMAGSPRDENSSRRQQMDRKINKVASMLESRIQMSTPNRKRGATPNRLGGGPASSRQQSTNTSPTKGAAGGGTSSGRTGEQGGVGVRAASTCASTHRNVSPPKQVRHVRARPPGTSSMLHKAVHQAGSGQVNNTSIVEDLQLQQPSYAQHTYSSRRKVSADQEALEASYVDAPGGAAADESRGSVVSRRPANPNHEHQTHDHEPRQTRLSLIQHLTPTVEPKEDAGIPSTSGPGVGHAVLSHTDTSSAANRNTGVGVGLPLPGPTGYSSGYSDQDRGYIHPVRDQAAFTVHEYQHHSAPRPHPQPHTPAETTAFAPPPRHSPAASSMGYANTATARHHLHVDTQHWDWPSQHTYIQPPGVASSNMLPAAHSPSDPTGTTARVVQVSADTGTGAPTEHIQQQERKIADLQRQLQEMKMQIAQRKVPLQPPTGVQQSATGRVSGSSGGSGSLRPRTPRDPPRIHAQQQASISKQSGAGSGPSPMTLSLAPTKFLGTRPGGPVASAALQQQHAVAVDHPASIVSSRVPSHEVPSSRAAVIAQMANQAGGPAAVVANQAAVRTQLFLSGSAAESKSSSAASFESILGGPRGGAVKSHWAMAGGGARVAAVGQHHAAVNQTLMGQRQEELRTASRETTYGL